MKVLRIRKDNFEKVLRPAVTAIKQGRVLVCPSDTVYGLVCDARNKRAVARIFKIKKRPKHKPLGVFARDIKAAKELAHINKKQEEFLKRYWPGKLTAVLKTKIALPSITFQKTIGVRVPDYKLLEQLLAKLQGPMAQTSANISGEPAAFQIKKVLWQFQNQKLRPDLIISAGDLEPSLPSTVVDLTSEKIKILRKGKIRI